MAHPWTYQENFEDGTLGNFDALVDTGGAHTYAHWKRLATNRLHPLPYRGAYVSQIDLASVTTEAYHREDAGFDLAAEATYSLRFPFFVSTDLVMAASDRFDLLQIRSAAAVEVAVGIVNTAGVIEVGASETSASAQQKRALELGVWHIAELTALVDVDADADGTIDFYLDGVQVGSQIGSLTQAAITNARLGVMGIDAGTTTGKVFIDSIILDDLRVFPEDVRKPTSLTLTKSEHAFVGPGVVSLAALETNTSGDTMRLYDTDTADIVPALQRGANMTDATHTSISGPLKFEKGCYVTLSGTDPIGRIIVDKVTRDAGYIYDNEAVLRSYAQGG